MKKFAPALSLLLAVSAAAAFDLKSLDMDKAVSGAAKVAKGAFKMSDKDEAALGRETGSYLCARYGLLKDPALTRYVDLVGQSVARRSDRPDIAYHFGVLDTDEINAYAAPGGYIFITKGMLALLKDEAELAGALAHEVAHVAKRHVAKAIQKANLLEGGIELASAQKDNPAALRAANDFTVGLLFKGFDRKDEAESDRAAVAYAKAAGYDPAGLVRVLERMAQANPGENRFKALGKSHPPAKDRLAVARKEAGGQPGGKTNAERFSKNVPTPS